jgi:hypothetical protein
MGKLIGHWYMFQMAVVIHTWQFSSFLQFLQLRDFGAIRVKHVLLQLGAELLRGLAGFNHSPTSKCF